MSGWVFLVCILVGGFMVWRERFLSTRKPPAIRSYLAGVLGGLAGAYCGRMLVQDPGVLFGEIARAFLFSVAGAGLALALVDLAARHQNGPPRQSAAP